jgi:hypothetical protein
MAAGTLIRDTESVAELSEAEFKATMDAEPVAVAQDESPPFDFWPYFHTIPEADFRGHDFSEGEVTNAWSMPISRYQHVLVRCETPNVYLVLVLDLQLRIVHGHRVLDLNELYGLT